MLTVSEALDVASDKVMARQPDQLRLPRPWLHNQGLHSSQLLHVMTGSQAFMTASELK